MSEFNQEQTPENLENVENVENVGNLENLENLGNLENILLESLNSEQVPGGDEFMRLQEILVDPELLKMRDRVLKVEQRMTKISQMGDKFEEIQEQFDEILKLKSRVNEVDDRFKQNESDIDKYKEIIKIILPIMSSMMNRQLNQFKQEIIQAIVPIVKQQQEDQRNLSIRIVGGNPENQQELNN